MIPKDSYEIIDTLIKQGRSFAIWRIPSEDRLHFRMQSAGSPCLLYDIKDLNERSGFVIAPFQVTAEIRRRTQGHANQRKKKKKGLKSKN